MKQKEQITTVSVPTHADSSHLTIGFVLFYVVSQLAGVVLLILIFSIVLYNSVSIRGQTQTILSELPVEAPAATVVSDIPESNSAAGVLLAPEGAAEALSEPIQVTPTPVLSSIAFITQDVCSPIQGVEVSDLSSIISQPYNVISPNSDFGHHGVDFGSYNFHGQGLYGFPLQSVFPGRVAGIVENHVPLGNAIIIETAYDELPERLRTLLGVAENQSIFHLYAHMVSAPVLKIGDRVSCGEVIGYLGKSQTAEAHLHFETRIGLSNEEIPDMAFYDSTATQDQMDAYLRWRTSGDFMPLDPMSLFSNIY